MGLAVCREILKKMGPRSMNQLFLDSTKNYGSRFYFFMRKAFSSISDLDQEQNKISSERDPAGQIRVSVYNRGRYDTQRKDSNVLLQQCECQKVLIVDDEQFNLTIIESQMNSLGFQCDKAYNGKEAIERFEKQYKKRCGLWCCIYRCILMDINMPVMSGWDSVKRIRQLEKELELQERQIIIAVSGFCGVKDKQKSKDAGFNFVMGKPTRKNKLLETFASLKIRLPNQI